MAEPKTTCSIPFSATVPPLCLKSPPRNDKLPLTDKTLDGAVKVPPSKETDPKISIGAVPPENVPPFCRKPPRPTTTLLPDRTEIVALYPPATSIPATLISVSTTASVGDDSSKTTMSSAVGTLSSLQFPAVLQKLSAPPLSQVTVAAREVNAPHNCRGSRLGRTGLKVMAITSTRLKPAFKRRLFNNL
ncbi:MAG: hypothetical protein Q8P73_02255 [bacterium]|nr:hypothetical protein [bacterium]